MIHSTFKQKLDASGNISGIYNYCNRFCEDCPFTEVCANYKMGLKKFPLTEDPGDFVLALEETLQESRLMIEKIFKELKIEPEVIEEDKDEIAWRQKIKEAVDKHGLSEKAEQYFYKVQTVFDELDKISAPEESLEMDLHRIVAFSCHILTKIKRALGDFYEMDPFSEDEFDVIDMNGCAKCVLVMVDDSINSWKKVIQSDPAVESCISELFPLLESLRKETETQFPDARAFIRGGFDEL